jgi:hypothetical protein
MYQLEEQQLWGGATQAGWTPGGWRPIQHQEFLRMQRDQGTLGRGETRRIKDAGMDRSDFPRAPIVGTMVLG